MSFRSSNFDGNFITFVFGKSICHYRELKTGVGHRDIYYAKKYLILSYEWRL